MNITTRQTELWLKILKFPASPEHLAVWENKLKTASDYQGVIDRLSNEKLTPLWQQARKNKADPAPASGKADPVLKNTWRTHMDFAPSWAHLVLLEKLIEKEAKLDEHFGKVTIDTLIDIIREVAQGTKPAVATPQANLNLPEGK